MGENICFADWVDSISFLCLVVILDMYNLVAGELVTYAWMSSTILYESITMKFQQLTE